MRLPKMTRRSSPSPTSSPHGRRLAALAAAGLFVALGAPARADHGGDPDISRPIDLFSKSAIMATMLRAETEDVIPPGALDQIRFGCVANPRSLQSACGESDPTRGLNTGERLARKYPPTHSDLTVGGLPVVYEPYPHPRPARHVGARPDIEGPRLRILFDLSALLEDFGEAR